MARKCLRETRSTTQSSEPATSDGARRAWSISSCSANDSPDEKCSSGERCDSTVVSRTSVVSTPRTTR